jgi:hypothetical protein
VNSSTSRWLGLCIYFSKRIKKGDDMNRIQSGVRPELHDGTEHSQTGLQAPQRLKPQNSISGHPLAKPSEALRKPDDAPEPSEPPAPPASPPGFWQTVGDFFTRGADAVVSLATGLVNGVVGAVKNLAEAATMFGTGVGRIFQGDVLGGLQDIGFSFLKGLQTPFDFTLITLGSGVSAAQTVLGLEPQARGLTEEELAEAKKVYGDSIDYSRVRIKAGEIGVMGISDRPFVLGDTIYFPKREIDLKTGLPAKQSFIHEMGHIWQHQHGGTAYLSEALFAQNFGEGYDFTTPLLEGKGFRDMNPEQKAQFIASAYTEKAFDSTPLHYFVTTNDGTRLDFGPQLAEAMEQIRRGEA